MTFDPLRLTKWLYDWYKGKPDQPPPPEVPARQEAPRPEPPEQRP